MAVLTYDPNKVTLVVGGKLISGYAEDTFITASRDEDMWQKIIGVDGVGSRAKTNNYAGSLTVTLLHTSPANNILQALATADEQSNAGAVPLQMRDNQGATLITAVTAWVKKLPDIEYGKGVGTRAWVLDSDNLQMAVGGTN